jgi:hypothetical protein
MHHRKVGLFHRSILKGATQTGMSPIVFGDDQESGSPFVDPVDNSRPTGATRAGQLLEPEHQALHERWVRCTCSGMDHQPGRLLNHGKVLVFVNNLERDLARLKGWLTRLAKVHLDDFIPPKPITRLLLPVSDPDRSGSVQ